MREVVVNSSPLIALSGLHRLDVLQGLYGEIYIPEAVYEEISAKQESVCKQWENNGNKFFVPSCQV